MPYLSCARVPGTVGPDVGKLAADAEEMQSAATATAKTNFGTDGIMSNGKAAGVPNAR